MSENLDTNTETVVEKISVDDMDNLLGMPGSESVMIPAEEQKPSFFSSNDVDVSFIDNNETTEKDSDDSDIIKTENEESEKPETNISVDAIIDEVDNIEDSKSGRPPLNKEGMAQLAKELSKDGLITPFEGEEDFENYTLNDYKELFNANFNEKGKQFDYNAKRSFFESLPRELQYAAQYIQDGGQDLKGLFSVLSHNEETKSLSTDSERGQQGIIRSYLQNTNFGNTEDIDEQIEEWNDLGKLEEKALKFKPKLDKMQEQLVQRQLKEQETKRKQQEDQAQYYMESIYNTLESAELNGIKLNSKIQNLLYSGLVQPNYPSISGKATNLFGHLIEKYQYVEPRHDLIAEALWLLADPEGYRNEISKNVKSAHVEETVRKLKTEQSSKSGTSNQDLKVASNATKRKSGITRPTKNFFKRT
jgi:hypothetical protein